MSIEPVTFWRAICDRCGENITERGLSEYAAWADEDQAVDDARDGDAFIDRDLVVCSDCVSPYWSSLDGDAWDALSDHAPAAVAALHAWVDQYSEQRSNTAPTQGATAPSERRKGAHEDGADRCG